MPKGGMQQEVSGRTSQKGEGKAPSCSMDLDGNMSDVSYVVTRQSRTGEAGWILEVMKQGIVHKFDYGDI